MNLFTKPKPAQIVQSPPPPPPVPTIDTAAQEEDYSAQLRRRRGHMANVTGASPGASTAARTLLG